MKNIRKGDAIIFVDGDGTPKKGKVIGSFVQGADRIAKIEFGPANHVIAVYSDTAKPGTFHHEDDEQISGTPSGEPESTAVTNPAAAAPAPK